MKIKAREYHTFIEYQTNGVMFSTRIYMVSMLSNINLSLHNSLVFNKCIVYYKRACITSNTLGRFTVLIHDFMINRNVPLSNMKLWERTRFNTTIERSSHIKSAFFYSRPFTKMALTVMKSNCFKCKTLKCP